MTEVTEYFVDIEEDYPVFRVRRLTEDREGDVDTVASVRRAIPADVMKRYWGAARAWDRVQDDIAKIAGWR